MMKYENSCKTSSGKEFEVRYMMAGVIGFTNVLNIEIVGKTIMEVATIFANPLETDKIVEFIEGNEEKVYNHYTHLINIGVLADSGNITVSLTVPQS